MLRLFECFLNSAKASFLNVIIYLKKKQGGSPMTAIKERLHHIIDEIQEDDAAKILEMIESIKDHKDKAMNVSTSSTSKVEWDPGVDDEVWKYVC